MKTIEKLSILCMLTCLLTLTFSLHPSADPLWETEPNDKVEQATEIDVNASVAGNLETRTCSDFYTFTLSDAGVVRISFSGESTKASTEAWMLTLYNSSNDSIYSRKVTDASDYESLRFGLDAGKYYVEVKIAVAAQYGPGQYTLTVNYEKNDLWERELSDTELLTNREYHGLLMTSEDEDCFVFTCEETVKFSFAAAEQTDSSATWDLKLTDSGGHYYVNGSVSQKEVTLESGTYKVVIKNGTVGTEYRLSVQSFHVCQWVDVEYQAPTCTENGVLAHRKCEGCGKLCDGDGNELNDAVIPSGHQWGAFAVASEPTCEDDGEKIRYCSECDAEESVPIACLGHDVSQEWTVDQAASCVSAGSKSHHCLRDGCEYRANITTVPAAGHQIANATNIEVEEATCTEAGEKKTYCTVSGCNGYVTESIPALTHDVSQEWTVDQAASCVSAGSKSHHCLRDGCEYRTNITTIPAAGHQIANATNIEVEEATCTEAGRTKTYCTVSGCNGFVVKPIPALEHDVSQEWTIDQAASCVSAGSKSHHCLREGCDHRANETIIPATGHQIANATKIEVKEATCTEAGEKKTYCTVSGCNGCVSEVIPALQHVISSEWTVDLEATCVASGSKSRHCLRDGCDLRRFLTEIPPKEHDHDEAFTVDEESTCTKQGVQSRHCKRAGCNDRIDVKPVPKAAHSMVELVSKSATCVQSGVLSMQCSVCNQQVDEVIPPTNQHVYGAWQEIRTPTCSAEGERQRICGGCGLAKSEAIPKLSHSYSQEWTVDALPTCTETGSESRRCAVCDHMAEQRSIPALGHDFDDVYTVDLAATCETAGSQSKHCDRCEEKGEVTEIPATGHAYGAWITTSAPTCVQKGKLSRTCGVCGRNQVQDTDSALGHDFGDEFLIDVEATCERAGSKSKHCGRCSSVQDETEIPALGHSFGAWSVTTSPTCTASGTMSRSCQTCHKTETKDTGSALGHDYDEDFTVDLAAGCESEGSQSRHCGRCDAKTEVTAVPAVGHLFGAWEEILAPTCSESGKEARICAVCEKAEERTGEAALGHDYGELAVDEEATCQSAGVQSRHCGRCGGRTEITTIPTLEHTYDNGTVLTEPTSETTGTKQFTCSECGDTYRQEMEKLPPVMLESADEVWSPKKEEPMTFRSAAALADFIEVRVNGEVVPRDCYILREGSTIVELKPEYLRTLKGGAYTLEIVSTTGIASAEFSVSDSGGTVWVWIAVAGVITAAGIVGAVILLKRKRTAPNEEPASDGASEAAESGEEKSEPSASDS